MKQEKFGKRTLLELAFILGIVFFIVYNASYAIGKFKANQENKESGSGDTK